MMKIARRTLRGVPLTRDELARRAVRSPRVQEIIRRVRERP